LPFTAQPDGSASRVPEMLKLNVSEPFAGTAPPRNVTVLPLRSADAPLAETVLSPVTVSRTVQFETVEPFGLLIVTEPELPPPSKL
jgi:hypothetical protein